LHKIEHLIKNQVKIHAKIGANVGAEEAPVLCNTEVEWARVRCNTLSKAQEVHWAWERGFRHKKFQNRLNEITS